MLKWLKRQQGGEQMNRAKAQAIADKYVLMNSKESAELVNKDYLLDGTLHCYAFYLTDKEGEAIKLVGLPEMLFVEKVTGLFLCMQDDYKVLSFFMDDDFINYLK